MAVPTQNNSNVPQGFSVYQEALGAQLQFFPAVGTPQLDELVNAYVPGTACIQDKRATVALDFFEHVQVTGESFKFYPVYSVVTPVESPMTVSSGYASSFNASPVMSNWDWSQVTDAAAAPRASASSRQRRQSKVSTPVSRHQTSDFSHLPGMKIMTKDGRDVTNSASRGSKTKEQRDHAHLMRIIKACDSCRRKKIRCDPSHKKRTASHAQAPAPKSGKKTAKPVIQQQQTVTPPVLEQELVFSHTDFTLDPSFTSSEAGLLNPGAPAAEPWEQFIQYPAAESIDDYDFFNDPMGYFSPQSFSSASPSKPDTPVSSQGLLGSGDAAGVDANLAAPLLPYNQVEPAYEYADFNLYSPSSSFSEDERMVPIEMSKHLTNRSHSSPADGHVQPPHQIPDARGCGQDEVAGGLTRASPESSGGILSISPTALVRTECQSDVHPDPGVIIATPLSVTATPSSRSDDLSYADLSYSWGPALQTTPASSGISDGDCCDQDHVMPDHIRHGIIARNRIESVPTEPLIPPYITGDEIATATVATIARTRATTTASAVKSTSEGSEGVIINDHILAVKSPRASATPARAAGTSAGANSGVVVAVEGTQSPSAASTVAGNLSSPRVPSLARAVEVQQEAGLANTTTSHGLDRLIEASTTLAPYDQVSPAANATEQTKAPLSSPEVSSPVIETGILSHTPLTLSVGLGLTCVSANYAAETWFSTLLSTALVLFALYSWVQSLLSYEDKESKQSALIHAKHRSDPPSQLATSRARLEALRCQATALVRPVGRMISQVGNLVLE